MNFPKSSEKLSGIHLVRTKKPGKMIHRKDSKGEVLRALLSKWQDNMKEPIIRTYGTFCLEQSGLARFRFLLLIEALEGEYDSIHKTEIETEKLPLFNEILLLCLTFHQYAPL